MAVKGLVAAIVQFLTQQLEESDITADSRESLEVAIQCLESAYNVQASDTPENLNLYEIYKSAVETTKPHLAPEASPEAKAEAERLKNEGNALMKAEKHQEALANYTKAIQLDSRNAVYYCNRAAVYSKIGNHQQAIKDCHTALSIDPSYSKAYGRLGLAYSSLRKHKEAKESYQKALDLEPDNEGYKNNLQVAEEKLSQQGMSNAGLGGGGPLGMEFSAFMNNPLSAYFGQQLLSVPAIRDILTNFAREQEGRGNMESLIEAGQQVVEQIGNTNPEFIETLRQQMGINSNNTNNPDPPQQN